MIEICTQIMQTWKGTGQVKGNKKGERTDLAQL